MPAPRREAQTSSAVRSTTESLTTTVNSNTYTELIFVYRDSRTSQVQRVGNTPARRSGPHLNPNRRNRTEANKCEHQPKHTVPAQPPLILFSAANKPNPAEQNRTRPNAETSQNVPEIFHFCPPQSHDLQQNTGFPRLDRPRENLPETRDWRKKSHSANTQSARGSLSDIE